MAKKTSPKKTFATIRYGADKRKNIPTAELQSVVKPDAQDLHATRRRDREEP